MKNKKVINGGNLMDDPVPENIGPLGLSRDCKAAGKAFDNLKREDEKAKGVLLITILIALVTFIIKFS